MLNSKLSLLRYITFIATVAVCLALPSSHLPTALEQVLSSGKLFMVSRNGLTTYYEGPNGLEGYEYQLAKGFADSLGVELVIADEDDIGKILRLIHKERYDFAAAGLSITPNRERFVSFSEPYNEVEQVVVYRSGTTKPRSIEDLYNKQILTISHSSHAETLRALSRQHPQLHWEEQPDLEMHELMEMVHKGELEFAILDSNAYTLNRHLYPRARKAFALSSHKDQLAWAFKKGLDHSLVDRANAYITHVRSSGQLAELNKSSFSIKTDLDHHSALTFTRRLETRLPQWQGHMESAGSQFSVDWMLLAALSYQESHWRSNARSHTGVRGLMMLTKATATEVGVEDRLDPVQSIYGGAKYLRTMLDRLPERIDGDDRTWLALAAYNVGLGHLEDARILTQRQGGDPDKWSDVKEALPLLAKRKYYRSTKHGYARGWEPVHFVESIRSFYNTLALHQQLQIRRLAALEKRALDEALYNDSRSSNELTLL